MISFLKQTQAELAHVVWPKQKQVWAWTTLIIIVAIAIAYFLDLWDLVFGIGLEEIVTTDVSLDAFEVTPVDEASTTPVEDAEAGDV